ncbi:MAG TPA: hypothetical protein VGL11_05055 [Candidatus Binatia bacterium]|jgi:L-ascorbate metabolism protein UlaG (beta-lactamase superfamily)
MHWGTFEGLTDEPPKRLAEALARENVSSKDFFLMQHGETRLLRRDSIPVRAAYRIVLTRVTRVKK